MSCDTHTARTQASTHARVHPRRGRGRAALTPAASHAKKGWEEFTDAVVKALSAQRSNLVFILWGAHAQKKGKDIDTVRAARARTCTRKGASA